MKSTQRAVVLLSGGIDSATSLYIAVKKYSVTAVTFVYNGIAKKELVSARAIANSVNIEEHRLVRLPDMKEAQDIQSSVFANMPSTYIPMRNSIFYSFAGSIAEEKNASVIIGGHINGDELLFKDATKSFFRQMQRLIWESSDLLRNNRTRILTPLSRLRKYQVVKKAMYLGVPLHSTWSCHKDGREHCWECDGCLSRIEAFSTAGIRDPLRNTKS